MTLRRAGERIRGLGHQAGSDEGAVALLTAILVPLFLLLTATAVDIGNWYVEAQKTQTAADAAATAGVTYLPQDPTSAFSQARATALANGFASSAVTTAVAGRPSQLLVTVSGTVTNIFGTIFGNPTTTISRSAVADYTAPAIMGSPCNALGNQPPSGGAGASSRRHRHPSRRLSVGGYTTCQSAAQFWMNIAGPATDKRSGDRYATRTNCSSGIDFCTSGTNDEYREDGYVLAVRVQPTRWASPSVCSCTTPPSCTPATSASSCRRTGARSTGDHARPTSQPCARQRRTDTRWARPSRSTLTTTTTTGLW